MYRLVRREQLFSAASYGIHSAVHMPVIERNKQKEHNKIKMSLELKQLQI